MITDFTEACQSLSVTWTDEAINIYIFLKHGN